MATDAWEYKDGSILGRTWIGDPPYLPPGTPYIEPWTIPPPGWPYVKPLTVPSITTTGKTAKLRFISKDVRDLLDLIHDELIASDEPNHLAIAELIEETLEG